MNVCTVTSCERPRRRNGPKSLYCEKHTYRFRRYGDATAGIETTHECWPIGADSPSRCGRCGRLLPTVPPFTRFTALIQITRTCWLWNGTVSRDGYGKFEPTTGMYMKAHRFAYETIVGKIPESLQIDHLCRVRRCVNPAHLEPVTIAENIRRGLIARRKV